MTQFPQITHTVTQTAGGRHRAAHRAVQIDASPMAIHRERSTRRGGTSNREQLVAAASSVVWFAAWFHSIYEDIRGESSDK